MLKFGGFSYFIWDQELRKGKQSPPRSTYLEPANQWFFSIANVDNVMTKGQVSNIDNVSFATQIEDTEAVYISVDWPRKSNRH